MKADFAAWIEHLRDAHLALWGRTPGRLPQLGPRTGFWRKRATARDARRLIDAAAAEARTLSCGGPAAAEARARLRAHVERFGRERLGWPEGAGADPFGEGVCESTVAFVRAARRFDPALAPEALGQALRNVWIGNWLQRLLGRRVELRPGLFAYSLLYPLTDNWLDDPAVSTADKQAAGERLAARLAGEAAEPQSRREAAVFRLVATIEEERTRAEHPRLYDSLLAIHGGQSKSVRQQGADVGDGDLLAISFEKGGASVLADLHLVAPEAGAAEERFAFGYGVALQLLDDLQDVEDDLAAGHATLFSRTRCGGGVLDAPALRLLAFLDAVLAAPVRPAVGAAPVRPAVGAAPVRPAVGAEVIEGARSSCRALLVGCMAEHPRHFSRALRRQVEAQWPLSFSAQRRLRRRAMGLLRDAALPVCSDLAAAPAAARAAAAAG